jgi:hypothetical protein
MTTSYFTKRFISQHGLLNFYFNRINTAEGVRFHVSCADGGEKTCYMFLMQEVLGQWHISDRRNAPEWLLSMEKNCSDFILEQMRQ